MQGDGSLVSVSLPKWKQENRPSVSVHQEEF